MGGVPRALPVPVCEGTGKAWHPARVILSEAKNLAAI
jgi:hypothetical protein